MKQNRFGKALSNLLGETPSKTNDSTTTNSNPKKRKKWGIHSIRKGVTTFASSGTTGGPSIVSICIRCGWSLGNVMERYFRYENAGDQFLGRVVAGLPVNNSNFSILPPHFPSEQDSELNECIKNMFPTISTVPHLHGVLKLVLASLVYHYEFLIQTMSGHALLSTPLFCNPEMVTYLRSKLIFGFESPVLRSAGIPPHVELYKRLDKHHESILSLPKIIIEAIDKMLEDKGVQAGNITREYLQNTVSTAIAGLTNFILAHVRSPAMSPISNGNFSSTGATNFNVFQWGGKFRQLPESFEFPSVDIVSAWRLWFLGNPTQKVLPYCKIDSSDLATRKKRNTLTEWRFIMKKLMDYYQQTTGKTCGNLKTEQQCQAAFEIAQKVLEPIMGPTDSNRARRAAQLKITTIVYNMRRKIGSKKKRPYKQRKPHNTTI